MKPIAAFVLIFLLALTLEGVGPRVAEGFLFRKKCSVPSVKYKGPCANDSDCNAVCKSEGMKSGDCHGLLRRCLCCRHRSNKLVM